MKLFIRISALSLIVLAAVASNSSAKTSKVASITPSSVPGGGGPMPTCNPFKDPNCPSIR